MALLGSVLKKGIELTKYIESESFSIFDLQKKELKKLIRKAKDTEFGQKFGFEKINSKFGYFSLKKNNKDAFYIAYKNQVPIYNYNTIFKEFWYKSLEGQGNICWPGNIKYFALSSGTSESASKYIPVTNSMLKAMKRTGIKQILSLKNFNIPPEAFSSGVLMIGGSTDLTKSGNHFEGDLSGITTGNIPFWFNFYYKPGKKISKTKDWTQKLELITQNAPNWDITAIAGVPAWIQILLEKIIKQYNLNNIHDIWPNLSVFTHGGVSFEPYKAGFEKLLARPLIYIETYLASEGFLAFQAKEEGKLKLVLNGGIFFEFIPFNNENFDSEGDLLDNPKTFMAHQVELGKDYAILISTCAGAWRYLIGDVVRFTNIDECEITIMGRTKHFLSLCGEHLSVDNMNKAVNLVAQELGIKIKEFTVAGIKHNSMFAHHWYIGTDDVVDQELLRTKIDQALCVLNDDYKTERIEALKEVFLDVLPANYFYEWLKIQGKEGAQTKFPRVIKTTKLTEWTQFLESKSVITK